MWQLIRSCFMPDLSSPSSTPQPENSAERSSESASTPSENVIAESEGSQSTASQSTAPETSPLLARLPPLFDLGQIVATPGALEALRDAMVEPEELFNRHQRGDWGDLCAEDREVNRKALFFGDRLLSSYALPDTGETVWILTEWDRSVTTMLLPKEY